MQIGLDQLLFGRFSTLWAEIQDSHCQSESFPTTLRGHHFVTGSIKIIFEHAHRLWKLRNECTHGSTASTREAAALAQATRELEEVYALRDRVRSQDQDLFYTSVSAHLAIDTTSVAIRSWLLAWRPVIIHSVFTQWHRQPNLLLAFPLVSPRLG